MTTRSGGVRNGRSSRADERQEIPVVVALRRPDCSTAALVQGVIEMVPSSTTIWLAGEVVAGDVGTVVSDPGVVIAKTDVVVSATECTVVAGAVVGVGVVTVTRSCEHATTTNTQTQTTPNRDIGRYLHPNRPPIHCREQEVFPAAGFRRPEHPNGPCRRSDIISVDTHRSGRRSARLHPAMNAA